MTSSPGSSIAISTIDSACLAPAAIKRRPASAGTPFSSRSLPATRSRSPCTPSGLE